ncbi:MAG TPA: virulence-associated E family protein [Rhizomicrobium sp.]|nr:virulence-associated E family protein [Rhizomicrobium sp.]
MAQTEFTGDGHTEKGIVCLVSHPPMPRHRVVALFETPFLIGNEGPTQAAAMAKWAKVPEAFARLLGVPLDTSCTDPSRLFYFPRHAEGKPFEVSLFGGPYFDWRSLELDSVVDRIAAVINTGKSKTKTLDGKAVADWWKGYARCSQLADLIQDHTDKVRHDTGHGFEIECPWDENHSNAGDPEDRACLVVNAQEHGRDTCDVRCQHEGCRAYTTLDFIGKMLADDWFTRELLHDPQYLCEIEGEPAPKPPNVSAMSPASLRSELVSLGTKPAPESVAAITDRIAAIENDADRDILFAVVIEALPGQERKRSVGKVRTRADADWKERRASRALTLAKPRTTDGNLPVPDDIYCDAKTGEIKPTYANCLLLLEQAHGDWGWAYDELAKQPTLRNKQLPWENKDDKHGCPINDDIFRVVRHFLIEQWGVTFNREDVREACLTLAAYQRFNPVTEYLDGLTWDGVERLEKWLITYAGAEDTPYVRGVGRVWMIAAVRRARHPGCKFDHVLILEAPTRRGKSTLFKKLAGYPTTRWFSDSRLGDVDKPDAMMKLRSRWIYELAELRDIRKGNSESLKAFFSSDEDFYRAPYDFGPMIHPRRCVFAGTVEIGTYLVDLTGNARYWPVKAGTIDLVSLERDRDMLWAEAAALEARADTSIMLDSSLWADAAAEQEMRLSDDPWTDTLRTHMAPYNVGTFLPTTDLLTDPLGIPKGLQTANHMSKLRTVIEGRIGGWDYVREPGTKRRGYRKLPTETPKGGHFGPVAAY